MTLQDKVAIVTGTSPNIGGGIAEGLAAAGAALVCADAIAANAEDCAAYLRSQGSRAIGITCDVCNEEQVKAAVDAACQTFGGIDILVNNAVIFNKKGVLDMPLDEWRQQIDVILTGAFLFTKYVAHSMRTGNRKGSIINIISTAGHQGEPGNIGYSTAKCGLMNLTRSAAMELSGYGIRVNSLTPTATDPAESIERAARWGRNERARPEMEAVMAPFRAGIPLRVLPVPSDYGHAAVFLSSDEARMITGTDLRVDAGAIARYWAWTPPAQA